MGPVATVGLSHSRGPVFTGGRQVSGPRSKQSQLPRICLRPPECNRRRVEQQPTLSLVVVQLGFCKWHLSLTISNIKVQFIVLSKVRKWWIRILQVKELLVAFLDI